MRYIFVFFFLFFCESLSAQDLEEQIYQATEAFNSAQSETALQKLNAQINQFKPQLSTIDEHYAFLFPLVNKAYYLNKKNKQQDAISAYEAVLKHYRNQKIGNTYQYNIVEYCLIPLGNLYTKAGDYTNAENTIKQYIFLAEKSKNNKQRVSGAINLGQLYYTVGKFQSAINIVENGLKTDGVSKRQRAKLEGIKANSLVASGKKSHLLANDVIITSTGEDYNLKYQIALKNKDYKKALSAYNMKTMFMKRDEYTARNWAKHYVGKAQLHYILQDFKKASKALKTALFYLLPTHNSKVLPEKTALYPENTFIDIFDLLARLQPNTKQALHCYDLSFYVSNLLTENLTSAEAKIIHLNNNRQRSEACISLLFNAYQQKRDTSHIKEAFAFAEKNKASILKEVIGKKSILALHPQDSLLLKEQELLRKNDGLTNDLIIAQYAKDSKKVNALSQKITHLSKELKVLKQSILKRYPNTNYKLELNKLQQKLKEDNAVLTEYFYGDEAIFQFIITPSVIDFLKIERDDKFNSSISRYISMFENSHTINGNIPTFKRDAHQLYNTLNFGKTSSYKNVVVIPDGLLNFIPFETLLTQKTTTSSYYKMPFVVFNQNLVYNSSAQFYINGKMPSEKQKLLGVFPVFENSNAELKYSINEAESLDNYTNAKFLMHNTATKKAFLDSANNYSILHLSTHASSGTFLEPSHIEFIDKTLYLNELYSLNIQPDLVVLSACETGIGKLQKGEGSMNLARGFQYAGAKSILFSLWKINDLSTSQLMHEFYKSYSKTRSADIANHDSKINYLMDEGITNIKKSPYYWSPFIYYGAVSKPQPNTVNYTMIALVVLGIVLLLLLYIKLKHARFIKRVSTK